MRTALYVCSVVIFSTTKVENRILVNYFMTNSPELSWLLCSIVSGNFISTLLLLLRLYHLTSWGSLNTAQESNSLKLLAVGWGIQSSNI